MESCPNCAAPTRPGAKFCTTCGFRLTDTSADSSAPSEGDDGVGTPPAASLDALATEGPGPPDALTAPPASLLDDDPSPGGTPAIAADDADDADDALGAADQAETDDPATPADQVLSSSWPAASATSWPSGWGSLAESAPSVPESTSTAPETEAPSWPMFPAEAAFPAPPLSESDPVTAEGDLEPVGSADAIAEESEDAILQAAASPDASDPTAVAPDAGGSLPPAVPLDDRVAPPLGDAPLPADAGDGETDPAARAAALVDELRALLPALSAAPVADLVAVAADLEAALHAAPSDDDLAPLRSAATAVRDRPRDLDALVDLAARSDAILDFLDARDHLTTAIERAIAALCADHG